jgi:O-antigen/teichoic acid export membrane protein
LTAGESEARVTVRESDTPTGFAVPAAMFVAGRLVSMAVGLLMIPLLVHSLSGQGFAAWAILLSCSAVFNELQMGMHTALVRAVAVAKRAEPYLVSSLWSSAVGFLVLVHVVVLPVIVLAARPLGRWLRLLGVGRWDPGTAILFVFVAVALRAVFLTGSFTLFAQGRFREVAALSVAQAFTSNLAATSVAWMTRDLGSTLLAFWTAQVFVAALGTLLAWRAGWRVHPRFVDARQVRRLLGYGVRVQLADWAQTINFQFDKFVIVRVLGLWPAALYEVGNRSVLALRSVPSSGMDTFLPVATQGGESGRLADDAPRRMALLSLYSILVFFAAPLAVAPVFLYAWVGEMGYVSRHVFAFLVIGAAANLIGLPVATMAQAIGRPEVQARAALASILVNVPLSLMFVRIWGANGAALGTSMAMVLGTVVLWREARAILGDGVVSQSASAVRRHWPLAVVCLGWGLVVHLVFDRWFLGTPAIHRYALTSRAAAAAVALAAYASCVLSLLAVKVKWIGIESEERLLLDRLAVIAGIRPRPISPGGRDRRRPEEAADPVPR